ncbi:MAG: STAS/SEC14 domain-containing protein [Desulfobulbaceae bacterium]|jgi:hypothetical protein|nr:STAS/SEC14 domain-containing protein [Desulfobulbaceae bacterium]
MKNERLPLLRLLFELLDFHGWNASTLWEDTKLGVQHLNDIERLAAINGKRGG